MCVALCGCNNLHGAFTKPMKRNKFFNKKVRTEVGIFDSEAEYNRYLHLKHLEDIGVISQLQRQVEYEIIPAQYENVEIKLKTKTKIKSKIVERPITYKCDFQYLDHNGELVVEDVKSNYTRKETDYILKRKMLLYLKGIRLKEFIV